MGSSRDPAHRDISRVLPVCLRPGDGISISVSTDPELERQQRVGQQEAHGSPSSATSRSRGWASARVGNLRRFRELRQVFATSFRVKPTRGVPYRGPRSVTIPRCCALAAPARAPKTPNRAVDRGHAGRPGGRFPGAPSCRCSFSTAQHWPTAAGSPISVCSGRGARSSPDVTRALDAARGVLWELETAA